MLKNVKYPNEHKERELASNCTSCARYERLIKTLIGSGVIREDLSIVNQAAEWVADFVPWAQAKPHCSFKTMLKFILEDGIGHKVGGQWKVDQNRYSALINGADFPPLKSAE